MKEVIAIIRMSRMNQTKEALTQAGVAAFFAQECQGRGKGLINEALLEGAGKGLEEAIALLGEKGRLYPKRIVTVVVPDGQVDQVVKTIIAVNRTGKPGDGKIIVSSLLDAVRVRTAERGRASIE